MYLAQAQCFTSNCVGTDHYHCGNYRMFNFFLCILNIGIPSSPLENEVYISRWGIVGVTIIIAAIAGMWCYASALLLQAIVWELTTIIVAFPTHTSCDTICFLRGSASKYYWLLSLQQLLKTPWLMFKKQHTIFVSLLSCFHSSQTHSQRCCMHAHGTCPSCCWSPLCMYFFSLWLLFNVLFSSSSILVHCAIWVKFSFSFLFDNYAERSQEGHC